MTSTDHAAIVRSLIHIKARPRGAETNGMVPPAAVTDVDVEPRLVRASDDDREAMRLLIELLAEV